MNGFAKDIQRYLDGDAVEACPPSAAYRLRKFALKHRAALVTAGAFALLLVVAATAVSAGLAVWANRERVRAVKAEKSAKEEQGRAQDREQMAIDAVRRYGDVVRETPELKNTSSLAKLRGTLLKEPQAFFKRLRDRHPADRETTPDSLARLAAASFGLGALTEEIGDKQDALRAYEESLAIRERLARENPSATEFQSNLAASHNNIGVVQRATGRPAEALESHERACAIQDRLASENPSVTEYQRNLASTQINIGNLQSETGRLAEGLASHEQGHAIRERLARENQSVTEFQSGLAMSHHSIALDRVAMGRPAEALQSYEQARMIRERLAREHPDSPDFASDLGATLNNMALIDLEQRQFDKARAKLTPAIECQRKALTANPNHPRYRKFLANHLTNLIQAVEGLGRAEEAALARRELAELVADDPAEAALDARLAAVLKRKETPKNDAERVQLAYRAYEKALHASAARLFAEALTSDTKLGDDRQAQHRFNAACAAALAGSGQGKNEPPPGEAARAKFRKDAREWLKAELAAWAKILDSGPAEMKAFVPKTLESWKTDADLAGIRDEKELAKLPPRGASRVHEALE